MRVVVVGAVYGGLAVALGAFSEHAMGGRFTPDDADLFQIAIFYQAFHAAVLVAMGGLRDHMLPALLGAASWAFGIGILLFCGTLYAEAFTVESMPTFLAPVGGGALITGWLLLAVGAARRL